MSDRITDSVEPFALATQGRTFEGNIPLAELQRLRTLVHSQTGKEDIEGDVAFSLRFDVDEGGVPHIGGSVRTTLLLKCQRCMEDMEYPVSTTVRLGIVPSREAAERLTSTYDPLVVSGDEITITSILEDELILALPIVAMHEIEACSQGQTFLKREGLDQEAVQENMTASKRENPFAVLAQLKETLPEDSTK
jgi:uncharacterized protein